MAGGVFTTDGRYWAVARQATSPAVVSRLEEISEHHLGSLRIGDFDGEDRAELLAQIRALPSVGKRALPDYPGRDGLFGQVEELVAMLASEAD